MDAPTQRITCGSLILPWAQDFNINIERITRAAGGDAGFVRTLFGQSIKAQDAQVLGLNQRIPHSGSGQLLSRALSLGIPEKSRYGPARRPPRLSRLRPPHRIKRPEGLRRLAP
jgi:hypothetical protein